MMDEFKDVRELEGTGFEGTYEESAEQILLTDAELADIVGGRNINGATTFSIEDYNSWLNALGRGAKIYVKGYNSYATVHRYSVCKSRDGRLAYFTKFEVVFMDGRKATVRAADCILFTK